MVIPILETNSVMGIPEDTMNSLLWQRIGIYFNSLIWQHILVDDTHPTSLQSRRVGIAHQQRFGMNSADFPSPQSWFYCVTVPTVQA